MVVVFPLGYCSLDRAVWFNSGSYTLSPLIRIRPHCNTEMRCTLFFETIVESVVRCHLIICCKYLQMKIISSSRCMHSHLILQRSDDILSTKSHKRIITIVLHDKHVKIRAWGSKMGSRLRRHKLCVLHHHGKLMQEKARWKRWNSSKQQQVQMKMIHPTTITNTKVSNSLFDLQMDEWTYYILCNKLYVHGTLSIHVLQQSNIVFKI
jgi:hypothetical protein